MNTFSIGWDVGAWMSKKGDALWILDGQSHSYGKPEHGNWGKYIEEARTAEDFLGCLFKHCGPDLPPDTTAVTLAIDAPLAFPVGFRELLTGVCLFPEPLKTAIDNPYLFRRTEAFAARQRKRNPLSPLQDMIGSQTTKIAHVLTKFGMKNDGLGVWQVLGEGGLKIDVIEAYPAMCKESQKGEVLPGRLKELYDKITAQHSPANGDEKDALICALIGHLHRHERDKLHQPRPDNYHPDEGWIWFPND
jgi:hypothetical protein